MCKPDSKTAIVFGGSGFVGRHLVRHFLDCQLYVRVIIGDLVAPPIEDECLVYLRTDVKSWIDPEPYRAIVQKNDSIIYNLAAICRIPGYPDKDYFETNILGAENVCAFANEMNCKSIVFTSSMAVYGASESEKREDTLPQPDNPYGISKLVAEHIHRNWHAGSPEHRLHILRPGIIFGKEENANFTRLYHSIAKDYFFYPGRRDTCKASIYVKDVAALHYYFGEKTEADYSVFNLVYPQAHTIEEICRTLARITGKRPPWLTIPGWLLLSAATVLKFLCAVIGKQDISLHPDRVRKVMISTNISGRKLLDAGYELNYSLEEAIKDWYQDNEGKGLW